jgi:hypothetical protein
MNYATVCHSAPDRNAKGGRPFTLLFIRFGFNSPICFQVRCPEYYYFWFIPHVKSACGRLSAIVRCILDLLKLVKRYVITKVARIHPDYNSTQSLLLGPRRVSVSVHVSQYSTLQGQSRTFRMPHLNCMINFVP